MTSFPPPDGDRPAESGARPSFEKPTGGSDPSAQPYGADQPGAAPSGYEPPPAYGQPTRQYGRTGDAEPPAYAAQQYGRTAPPEQYGQGQYGQGPYGDQQYGQQGHGQPPAYGQGQPPQGYGQAGYPGASPYGGYPVQTGPGQNGLGIAGMILGISSLVLFWIPFFGGFLGLLGAILSGVALPQSKSRNQNLGMPIAGLVCGIIGVIGGILYIFVLVAANSYDPYYDY